MRRDREEVEVVLDESESVRETHNCQMKCDLRFFFFSFSFFWFSSSFLVAAVHHPRNE